MICESVDLKAYALGEGTPEERRAVQAHIATCADCREEVSRVEATHAGLLCLRDEEIPRRIGFVSDQVFEPNWWQRFWASGPRLAFAGTAMLAVAIVIHGFAVRPAPISPSAANTAAIETRVQQQVAERLDSAVQQAVAKAVAESEARQQQQMAGLLAAADRKHQSDLRAMQVAFEEDWRIRMKQLGTMYVAVNRMDAGGGQ